MTFICFNINLKFFVIVQNKLLFQQKDCLYNNYKFQFFKQVVLSRNSKQKIKFYNHNEKGFQEKSPKFVLNFHVS